MKCVLAVCAESVIRDAMTNMVSVINVLDEIPASNFPILIPKMSALFLLTREKDEPAQIECTMVVSVGDEEVGRFPMGVDFGDKLRNRLMAVVQGVPVPGPGVFRVTLLRDDVEMCEWTAEVTVVPEPKFEKKE